MKFDVRISIEVFEEIEKIHDWYFVRSPQAALNFVQAADEVVQGITENPFLFAVRFKHFRAALLPKYPYLIVYETAQNTMYIMRIIHTKTHPKKRYRRPKRTQ